MPKITVTHITTATALLAIDDVVFLTDPAFCPAHTEFPITPDFSIKTSVDAALSLAQLPAIDAVLLSHEDHPDNLDDEGRKLLDGRNVFTTPDGAKNLAPRPAVRGLKDWETTEVTLQGKKFKITATPCTHLPGGECIGFIIESDSMGKDSNVSFSTSSPVSSPHPYPSPVRLLPWPRCWSIIFWSLFPLLQGRPNAVWFTGDSIYLDSWKERFSQWNIILAVANFGAAKAPTPDGGLLQITMGGADAIKIVQDLGISNVVPMHFDGWGHFTEHGKELKTVLEEANVSDKVHFVEPGVAKEVLTIWAVLSSL
jgi:L-ascorbate metabolism protein UlaG (beta-lactamase superfamily)